MPTSQFVEVVTSIMSLVVFSGLLVFSGGCVVSAYKNEVIADYNKRQNDLKQKYAVENLEYTVSDNNTVLKEVQEDIISLKNILKEKNKEVKDVNELEEVDEIKD